jgi:ABC-type Fe3+ transport system permease subunit
MPESRRRKLRKAPTTASPQRQPDADESPRPRKWLQSIAAIVIVMLIASSMIIGVVMPFFASR